MGQLLNRGGCTDPLQEVRLSVTEARRPAADFCQQLENSMQKATWAGVDATRKVLPVELLQSIVQAVTAILDKEPTLVEIQPADLQQHVTVVGDTHGQYQDVCRLFQLFGHPSADRIYIFNGDYVDRGAWGVETLTLLMAWKWALPNNVYLLRGNHETNAITRVYGFYAELKAKYGPASKGLFTFIRRMFACLPLAALVHNTTLILHGGLFRAPPRKGQGKKRRRSGAALTLGTLDDLRKASKGGQDPDPERSMKNCIASDVMWSDPVNAPGLRTNDARGCGTVYGPDVTQLFLSANGLKLIIRSHEGPDARAVRPEEDKLPSVDSGYAVDHEGPNGKLVTLFSAPDYPTFMAEGEPRYNNQGAVLNLSGPDYATPLVKSFDAVLPRPPAESYYEVPAWTDDEDDTVENSEDARQTESNAAAVQTASGSTATDQASMGRDPAGDRQLAAPDEFTLGAIASEAAAAAARDIDAAAAAAAQPASGSCLIGGGAAAMATCGSLGTIQQEDRVPRKTDCTHEPGTSSTAGPADAPDGRQAAAVAAVLSQTPQQQQQQQQSTRLAQARANPNDVSTDDIVEGRPAKRHQPEPAAHVPAVV